MLGKLVRECRDIWGKIFSIARILGQGSYGIGKVTLYFLENQAFQEKVRKFFTFLFPKSGKSLEILLLW